MTTLDPAGWTGGERLGLLRATRHMLTVGGEEWEVLVAVPSAAVAGPGPYPVLYLSDPSATFATSAAIAQTTHALSDGQLHPVVVVGVGPGDRRRAMAQRNRDLTPTVHKASHMPEGETGGARHFLDLLADIVMPFVEDCYPIDPSDRALGGWSLGGLFVCHVLVSRPELFRRYLAVSPSLWWDHQVVSAAAEHLTAGTLAGRDVYLAVGEHEASEAWGAGRAWPSISDEMMAQTKDIDMRTDLGRFAAALRSGTGADVHDEIITDEHHATVWAAGLTRGVVHLHRVDRN